MVEKWWCLTSNVEEEQYVQGLSLYLDSLVSSDNLAMSPGWKTEGLI